MITVHLTPLQAELLRVENHGIEATGRRRARVGFEYSGTAEQWRAVRDAASPAGLLGQESWSVRTALRKVARALPDWTRRKEVLAVQRRAS